MKRILYVITTSDFGGTETFLHELVSRLDRRRFHPFVLTLCAPGRAGHKISSSGVTVESFAMSQRPGMFEMLSALLRLRRLVDRHSIDLIHALLYRANVLAALGGRVARTRPVVVAGQRSLTPMSGSTAGLAARWTRRFCDRIVAVSDAVRQEMIHNERVDPARITVIGNGVDTRRFRPVDRRESGRRLGLGDRALLAGAVGRLAVEKGFHKLLEALALARSEGLELELLLAGEGPERARLEKMARELSIERCVSFLGMRRDLEAIYPALDIFVLPSLEEGSPNALLEAMACGCAVLASAVGGVPQIVEHERSGWIVEPGSARALVRGLVRLGRDSRLRGEMGRLARQRVEAHFDIAETVASHERLYLALLNES